MAASGNVEESRRVCVLGAERLIASALEDLRESTHSFRNATVWRGAEQTAMEISFAYCAGFAPFMTKEQTESYLTLEDERRAALAERELPLERWDEAASVGQQTARFASVVIEPYNMHVMDASIVGGKPSLDIEYSPERAMVATDVASPMTLRFLCVPFEDRTATASVMSTVLSRLRAFHRRQVMGRFEALVRSGRVVVPLHPPHFRQMVRDAYNKPGVFGPAVASFVKENVRLVPLYLEYLHMSAHRYDVSLVLSRWPFTTQGEAVDLFRHCWLLYAESDAYDSVGLIAEWIIIANHRDRGDQLGAWQCTKDPYFQIVWDYWSQCDDDWSRQWIVRYLPVDLARLQVSHLRQLRADRGWPPRPTYAHLRGRYVACGHRGRPQSQEESDQREAADKREVHSLLLTMASTAVKNENLYTKASLRHLLDVLLELAGVERNNHRDAVEWINALAAEEGGVLGGAVLEPLVSYLEASAVK